MALKGEEARSRERKGSTGKDDRREEGGDHDGERKQIYLRSVYPLNPGIPHFVDVPGGW
jgi:hypothetical protein